MTILIREPKIKVLKRIPKRPIKELLEHSLVVLNKSRGPYSREATRFFLEFGFQKVGHAGTLDPITTGVLPVFLNRGNKISGILSLSRKVYVAVMKLHGDSSEKELIKVFKKFTGVIQQLVPRKSAVKRQVRPREIYKLQFEEMKGRNVKIYVECQAGTYVRKLIHDIGQELGFGAHMAQLERVKSGPFTLKDAHTEKKIINALKSKDEQKIRKVVIPLEKAVAEMKKVWIDDGVLKPFSYGSPIYFAGLLQFSDNIEQKDKVAIFSRKNELIGIGIAKANSKNLLTKKEGIAIRNDINLLKPK